MGVRNCYMETRVSNKSGKEYVVLVLIFDNDYKMDVFLSNEQQFILKDIPMM